jgi:hypothetical protein
MGNNLRFYGITSRNPNKRMRTVTVMGGYVKGEKSPMWGFTIKYLADLMNLSTAQLKRYIKAGKLNPGDFKSIIALYNERQAKGKLDPEWIDIDLDF